MTSLYEPETLHFHDMRVLELKRLNETNSAYYGRLCLARKRRDYFLKNNMNTYRFKFGGNDPFNNKF